MRVSSKGRYALASMITMAQSHDNDAYITVISISEKLGISKIYLEQVFSLLKRGSLVSSVKGAQGGYKLARSPQKITAYDILASVESALFEPSESTVYEKAPEIDAAMHNLAFDALDKALAETLGKTTLSDLVNEAEKLKTGQSPMFFI